MIQLTQAKTLEVDYEFSSHSVNLDGQQDEWTRCISSGYQRDSLYRFGKFGEVLICHIGLFHCDASKRITNTSYRFQSPGVLIFCVSNDINEIVKTPVLRSGTIWKQHSRQRRHLILRRHKSWSNRLTTNKIWEVIQSDHLRPVPFGTLKRSLLGMQIEWTILIRWIGNQQRIIFR